MKNTKRFKERVKEETIKYAKTYNDTMVEKEYLVFFKFI